MGADAPIPPLWRGSADKNGRLAAASITQVTHIDGFSFRLRDKAIRRYRIWGCHERAGRRSGSVYNRINDF
jgi:hypothetical protein